jgi:hypothetical protein
VTHGFCAGALMLGNIMTIGSCNVTVVPPAPAKPGFLVGTLTDFFGDHITGAIVTLSDFNGLVGSGSAGATGEFRVSKIKSDSYSVTAKRSDSTQQKLRCAWRVTRLRL